MKINQCLTLPSSFLHASVPNCCQIVLVEIPRTFSLSKFPNSRSLFSGGGFLFKALGDGSLFGQEKTEGGSNIGCTAHMYVFSVCFDDMFTN